MTPEEKNNNMRPIEKLHEVRQNVLKHGTYMNTGQVRGRTEYPDYEIREMINIVKTSIRSNEIHIYYQDSDWVHGEANQGRKYEYYGIFFSPSTIENSVGLIEYEVDNRHIDIRERLFKQGMVVQIKKAPTPKNREEYEAQFKEWNKTLETLHEKTGLSQNHPLWIADMNWKVDGKPANAYFFHADNKGKDDAVAIIEEIL